MQRPMLERPILFAHRGASSELPENTLPAFERALEVGATAIETDAHLTRDGHVVLAHDDPVTRTAGLPRRISEATLEETAGWDVGAVMRGSRPEISRRGFTIPTLAEVLAALPGVPFNVDIKRHDAWAARAVVDVVRRYRAQDRVRLASFDAATLRAVRAQGYEGETGLGASEVARLVLLGGAALRVAPLRGNAAQIPTRMHLLQLDTPAFLAKAHALGLAVHYWTIDDPIDAERLLLAGADGIMTNDPRRIAPVFARLRGLREPQP
jgi:glycerophosphoryl diester phosphodiesterase